MPGPTRINRSLLMARPGVGGGAAPVPPIVPPRPGVVKTVAKAVGTAVGTGAKAVGTGAKVVGTAVGKGAKAVGKDVKGAAMVPVEAAVGTALNTPKAVKNMATRPIAATKGGAKYVAESHVGLAKSLATPVKTAKSMGGPLTLGARASMAATGGGIGPAFVRGAAKI